MVGLMKSQGEMMKIIGEVMALLYEHKCTKEEAKKIILAVQVRYR